MLLDNMISAIIRKTKQKLKSFQWKGNTTHYLGFEAYRKSYILHPLFRINLIDDLQLSDNRDLLCNQ